MPVLLLISYSSVKFYQNARFSNTFRFLSGLLVIFFALTTINSQLGVLGLPNIRTLSTSARTGQLPTTKANIVSGNSNTEIQVIQMEARGFEYFPKTIQIKAGLNTRFEITDNGSVGCARAVYARGLYPDVIKIQPGLNVVEFKAPAPGTYLISCSMWMVDPVTVIVK